MSRWQADLTLVFITVIWGSTFVMVKNALDDVQPMTFVAWRFWIATLVLVLLFRQQARTISRAEWRAGMLIGLFLAMGYIFQTIGLQYTTSAKAGFITGLNIVLVPIFSAMLLRQAPGRWAVLGVILATVGLALLSLNADLTLQRGDAWVMACAVAFALHIVSISHFTARHSAISLAIVQIATVALAATLAAFVFEQPRVRLPLDTWGAIAFTGVVATA
ncbi:MAG: EamA family transporter, partial [Ardenticatenia bacterium]